MSNRFLKLFVILSAAMLVFTVGSMLLSKYADDERKIMPPGFVFVNDIAPQIISELRFYNGDNFIGRAVDGYQANAAILSKPAAEALAKANADFMAQGYCLKIWDAYRPQAASTQFQRWLTGSDNLELKARFYPRRSKPELAEFLPRVSQHTWGSAVDVTLVDMKSGQELDMGTDYALMDSQASLEDAIITPQQQTNRETLRQVMLAHGFEANNKAWWHFHLLNEPYANTYFDFPIKEKGAQ